MEKQRLVELLKNRIDQTLDSSIHMQNVDIHDRELSVLIDHYIFLFYTKTTISDLERKELLQTTQHIFSSLYISVFDKGGLCDWVTLSILYPVFIREKPETQILLNGFKALIKRLTVLPNKPMFLIKKEDNSLANDPTSNLRLLLVLKLISLTTKNEVLQEFTQQIISANNFEINTEDIQNLFLSDTIEELAEHIVINKSTAHTQDSNLVLLVLYFALQEQLEWPSLEITKVSLAKDFISLPFTKTIKLLKFVQNEEQVYQLLEKVYNSFGTQNYITIIEDHIKTIEVFLSKNLFYTITEVFQYEKSNFEFLIQYEYPPDLFRKEFDYDLKNLHVSEITDDNVLRSLRYTKRNNYKIFLTKWKWLHDSQMDYEPFAIEENLITSSEDSMNIMVVNSLSTRCYFEYTINKYNELLLTLSDEEDTVELLFSKFYAKLGISKEDIEKQEAAWNLVKKEIILLFDRSIFSIRK